MERNQTRKREGGETLTDNEGGERERESERCLALTEGESKCSESELPLGSESRESRSEHNPLPPPRERALSGGRAGERGAGGGRSRGPAPISCCVHMMLEERESCSNAVVDGPAAKTPNTVYTGGYRFFNGDPRLFSYTAQSTKMSSKMYLFYSG